MPDSMESLLVGVAALSDGTALTILPQCFGGRLGRSGMEGLQGCVDRGTCTPQIERSELN